MAGWNANISMDRYGQLFFSPYGGSFGKSAFNASASLTGIWILQRTKPTSNETYNFLSGHGISIAGGYFGGVNWAISPTNKGAQNAVGVGFFTPQIGASYNYTPDYFIYFKK